MKNIVVLVLLEASLLVLALPLYYGWLNPDERWSCSWPLPLEPLLGSLLAFLGLAMLFTHPEVRRRRFLKTIYRKLYHSGLLNFFSNQPFGALLLLSCVAGLSEEWLFRGVLLPKWGLLLSSLLFGLVHALTWSYFFLATFIGLLLGLTYQSTHCLYWVMFLHALYDFLVLWRLKKSSLPFD
ncbi:MAG: CPBP family intramembrane metalloprotease [Bdellovibrio sp.]|nr:MAG: CPBP family intramembrane metalloprotease [Bdellovibrio sp.]